MTSLSFRHFTLLILVNDKKMKANIKMGQFLWERDEMITVSGNCPIFVFSFSSLSLCFFSRAILYLILIKSLQVHLFNSYINSIYVYEVTEVNEWYTYV